MLQSTQSGEWSQELHLGSLQPPCPVPEMMMKHLLIAMKYCRTESTKAGVHVAQRFKSFASMFFQLSKCIFFFLPGRHLAAELNEPQGLL